MSFPQSLDATALGQLARFATGSDRDTARLALAAYDLTGFALGKIFPNAAYLTGMVQEDPLVAQVAAQVEADPKMLGPVLERLLEKLGPIALQLLLDWLSRRTTP